MSRPVCKPHSVRQVALPRRSSIWAARLRAARAAYPGLWRSVKSARETSRLPGLAPVCPCLALLPLGVAWPRLLPGAPVVSYTTFSPLPAAPALCLCGPIRQVTARQSVDWQPAPAPGVTRQRALRSADFPLNQSCISLIVQRSPDRPGMSMILFPAASVNLANARFDPAGQPE